MDKGTVAEILWYAIPFTPLITIPLIWYAFKGSSRIARVILGLVLAAGISFFLYHISLSIIFRDGMGPG
jgi:multisubunit Na+/H+ antiporter MnhE subunit